MQARESNKASGMSTATLSSELRELYLDASAKIQQQFAATGDGCAALQQRTRLVEGICQRLWQQIISPEERGPSGFALVALGGFGREWLFPHSDVDVLFLHANSDAEPAYKDSIRRFSQELWDLRMKVSPTIRTLAECDRFDAANVEFTISLLDCRTSSVIENFHSSTRQNHSQAGDARGRSRWYRAWRKSRAPVTPSTATPSSTLNRT